MDIFGLTKKKRGLECQVKIQRLPQSIGFHNQWFKLNLRWFNTLNQVLTPNKKKVYRYEFKVCLAFHGFNPWFLHRWHHDLAIHRHSPRWRSLLPATWESSAGPAAAGCGKLRSGKADAQAWQRKEADAIWSRDTHGYPRYIYIYMYICIYI